MVCGSNNWVNICSGSDLSSRTDSRSPVIGGTLARPQGRIPGFSHSFWAKFPYFLPCAASAVYSAFAFALTLFLLKEVVVYARFVFLSFTQLHTFVDKSHTDQGQGVQVRRFTTKC